MNPAIRERFQRGVAIPACPLALTASRRLDERRQRALCRYYLAAGVGGLAVAVHTTQFAIRDPKIGLFEPVLAVAAEELNRTGRHLVKIAGVCGATRQATGEAALVHKLGYHAALLSLAALDGADVNTLIAHCQAVAEIIPIVGFYVQPAVGGQVLLYSFWRRFLEIPNVVAVKIAPFNRYQTLDVVRAVADSGRSDVALYTGNDDNIVIDLLTPFPLWEGGRVKNLSIVGGLLGHWAVWTQRAVQLLEECHALKRQGAGVPAGMLRRAVEVTDCNAAFFDAANGFAGCIAGLHEILRRQGLLEGIWCLDPRETLGPGQLHEIDRVCRTYPHLNDDVFVAAHRDDWLRP